MSSETIVAVSGLIGLGAAVLTGALWDSLPVVALLRLPENLRSAEPARDAALGVWPDMLSGNQ